jgi:uncharacterized protein YdiU (UPF0061 family)
MNVGFIHGVQNTDNVTVSGETIDFGPCAFIEGFDPAATFSSIDEGGRYAYGRQPSIGQWNMARLAEALLPVIAGDPEQAVALATEALDTFGDRYRQNWLGGARRKLGLSSEDDDDQSLVDDWLAVLARQRIDFTLAWRRLAEAASGDLEPLKGLFTDHAALDPWLGRWQDRLAADATDPGRRAARMRLANPIYIPRNHLVEEALTAAVDRDDLAPFDRLLAVVSRPYEQRPGDQRYEQPAAPGFTAAYRTFCGT